MIDLSNVIALALGSDDVLQIQDAIGTVLWQKITYYNVSITTSTGGTVSVNGISGNYSHSVASGTVLTIEGTGNTGYDFDQWSDGNTDNPRTVTVNSDITLTAAFEADLINTYFYIENPNDSSVTLTITKNINTAPTVNVSYSEDQIHWLSMGDTSTTGITHNVNAHRKLYLKATTSAWGTSSDNNRITVNGNFNVGGNIMSLLYSDNFQNQTSVNSYALKSLFASNTNLLSAGNLKIPATIVHEGSYYQLFSGCSSLTAAPTEISATTLATKCYLGMFNGCTALTTAPVLPATTLATFCYSTMFKDCTALTTAPVLPATTLLQSSYASLFNGCSSLNSVTSYAQDISATYCTSNWLNGVSATGDFYNLGGATYTSGDPSGIPTGWTEHTSL